MFPRKSRIAALSLTALLTISGCAAVGPDPTDLPETQVPATFAEGEGQAPAHVTRTAFWSSYQDRTLSQMIAEGLGNSLDILAANERIRAAEADLRATAPLAAQVTGDDVAPVAGRRCDVGDLEVLSGPHQATALHAQTLHPGHELFDELRDLFTLPLDQG